MIQEGWQVVFVPFHYPEDGDAGRKIAGLMAQDAMVLSANYTPQETMANFEKCRFNHGDAPA